MSQADIFRQMLPSSCSPRLEVKQSTLFPEHDEATLYSGTQELVSFLYGENYNQLPQQKKLQADFGYFAKKYLPALGKNRKIELEKYRISWLDIQEYCDTPDKPQRLSFGLEFKVSGEDKLEHLWQVITQEATQSSWLEAWMRLNSAYKQLRKKSGRYSPSMIYLERLQLLISAEGYDEFFNMFNGGLPRSSSQTYPVQETEIRISDSTLAGKEYTAKTWTKDLREAVFFEIETFAKLIEQEYDNPHNLTLENLSYFWAIDLVPKN